MDKEIIERLYFYDSGDGVEYELWKDSLTNQVYKVPIEIVRDWDNIKELST
jgi:hypothetical protein